MLFNKLLFGIFLLGTLNVVRADDDEDEGTSPTCLNFAQTCIDLCLENGSKEYFSLSCTSKNSLCKCDEEDMTSKVVKDLYGSSGIVDSRNMKLQVEEQDANIAPMKMLNLVLEDDVNYDEIGQVGEEEEEDANQETNENMDVLEQIKLKENLDANEEEEELEYVDTPPEIFEMDAEVQNESGLFCPIFRQRCKDDCPAAPSRSSCTVPDSGIGYLLVCDCNGVDISNSVRKQVLAEVFHTPYMM